MWTTTNDYIVYKVNTLGFCRFLNNTVSSSDSIAHVIKTVNWKGYGRKKVSPNLSKKIGNMYKLAISEEIKHTWKRVDTAHRQYLPIQITSYLVFISATYCRKYSFKGADGVFLELWPLTGPDFVSAYGQNNSSCPSPTYPGVTGCGGLNLNSSMTNVNFTNMCEVTATSFHIIPEWNVVKVLRERHNESP